MRQLCIELDLISTHALFCAPLGVSGQFVFSAKSDGRKLSAGVGRTVHSVDFIGFPVQFEKRFLWHQTKAVRSIHARHRRIGGRKRQMTDSKFESAKKLLSNGVPPRDVGKDVGVSVPTLYRWIPASASA
jgi:hypothetical protein